MLRALLDTHSFLWFVTADTKLSATAEDLISQGENEILLSVASVWEIAIKLNTGRLPIPAPLQTFIRRARLRGGPRAPPAGRHRGVNAGEGAPDLASPPRLLLDQNLAPTARFARVNP
jgi:hypothetical protein